MTKLFEGRAKDRSNADIGWMHSKSPFYCDGYKNAARELSSNFENRRTEEKDSLVFPIVFLYRQYIELSLKDLIRELDLKLKNNRNDKVLEKHNLLPLWHEAIKLYEQLVTANALGLIFTDKTTSKELSIISQFDKLDKGSFSFRYATDKNGTENLEKINYISVNNFKENIELVVKYIENMIETIYHSYT